LGLSEFLADDHGVARPGQAVVMAPSKGSSWAEEMEEGEFTFHVILQI